jgi:hypothetical protein
LASHRLRGGDELADVPLGVFGDVKEQAQDRAGQARAPHGTRFQQVFGGGAADLGQCHLDGGLSLGEGGSGFSGIGRTTFGPSRRALGFV